MTILLIGGSGMLGQALREEFRARGWVVIAPHRSEVDVTDPSRVAELTGREWDALVNASAYTAVDKAESEPDEAMRLNALAPGYLAEVCSMCGRQMVHYSTDFVFDGRSSSPYRESDATHPLNTYGKTKLEGEEAVLARGGTVLRTAWLFGPHRGGGFPGKLVSLAREGKALRVVSDQIGTPTYTVDLARVTADLLVSRPPTGLYHTAGADIGSWFELAEAAILADQKQRDARDEPMNLTPITTADWPTPALRPAYSALDSSQLREAGVSPPRGFRDAIEDWARRWNSR